MIDTACLFCKGQNDAVLVREENGYSGWKCVHCALIYVSPRPVPEDIVALYEHSDVSSSFRSYFRAELFHRLRARRVLRSVRRHVRAGRLVELGFGDGYFLDEARDAGFDVLGLELNPVALAFAERVLRLPVDRGTPADLPAGDTFDVICHSDLISHLPDPLGALVDMRERLRPGGLLVLETGNLADVDPQWYPAVERFQYPDHLYLFGEASLSRLLDAAGFTVVTRHAYSLMPALRLRRALRAAAGVRSSRTTGASSGVHSAPETEQFKASRLHRAMQLLSYVTRYWIGAVAPRRGRPQTVLVIATPHQMSGGEATASPTAG